ncbi:LPS assembly protein LptD [Niveispirillum sp. BGYR6]|uniref:LPS-assembly protein LptD n=1 Tax=Niveispirillum sp. BGYR6 TaxID=2971249 RepID=UPI0022B9A959|nr:LPS assembly protein LptD [Niveispirillum sp. BGYR6]MDG5497061.1 LPS assembly protein LptD [Niveispirillum sp. BGYR6]
MTPTTHRLRRLLLCSALALGAPAAWAQTNPVGTPGVSPVAPGSAEKDKGKGQPVLLSADHLDYDEDLGIVTARGHVELSQGARLLLADTVSFSEKTNIVTASGNVSILEPTGEVLFANYTELSDDLSRGFVDQVRILMSDNSKFAALQGERLDGRYTRMEKGVYSPCELCASDPTRPPIWQIRAARITHDQEKHDIYYRDATLEVMGVPVMYMPFFGHPDPTVERRSGFLPPAGGISSDLGTYARIKYFFDIDESKDFTLEAVPSTEDDLLLGGEYRQRFGSGSLNLSGSATYADRPRIIGNQEVVKKNFRGHIFANGRFDIDQNWRWGFDLRRVTDNTHLLRYDYSAEDILNSRAFVEWFSGRDYFSFNAYDFQDLRPANREEEPVVLPMAQYNLLGEPGSLLGGRWEFDAGLLSLLRSDGNDTRRLSSALGWRRSDIAPIGLVSTLNAEMRTDGYWVSDLRRADGTVDRDDKARLRAFPHAEWTVSMPLARQMGTVQHMVEPMVMLSAAPNISASSAIPNEDSQDIEFDYTNLFSASRYNGIDRLEGGQRVTYGVKNGFYGFGGGSSTLFVGQSYRLQKDTDFPESSGLRRRSSDVVGKLELSPSPWMDVSYSFRLDSKTLAQRLHDVYGTIGPQQFRVSGGYVFIDKLAQSPTNSITSSTSLRDREELTLAINSAITEHWSVGINHRRDLAKGGSGPLRSGATITYQDECLTFQLVGERNYTERTGVDTGDRLFFRVVLKNLGEFMSPAISGKVFGEQR